MSTVDPAHSAESERANPTPGRGISHNFDCAHDPCQCLSSDAEHWSPEPVQDAESVAAEKARTEPTWPIEKLPFEWEYIKGFPESVTIQLLVHRLNCCAEAILEIGERLDDWWEAQVEAGEYPLDDMGYRSLPDFYEQWLMNSAYASDCTRLVVAYHEAVRAQQFDGQVASGESAGE
jgi:hypothetical protein